HPKNPQHRRYRLTMNFIKDRIHSGQQILDLGAANPFSARLKEKGYLVRNTDFDLDKEPEKLKQYKADVCMAFEIFEHLLNPLTVLQHLPGNLLFASVPMSLWFSGAYRNKNDPWDCHFHEFEDWQFDWLLDYAGWKIIRHEKWTNPTWKPGVRPLLRLITPRWYVVEAVRK
ncbi:MAG: hypothetical protein WD097_01370, partial [Balneolales bacterium]